MEQWIFHTHLLNSDCWTTRLDTKSLVFTKLLALEGDVLPCTSDSHYLRWLSDPEVQSAFYCTWTVVYHNPIPLSLSAFCLLVCRKWGTRFRWVQDFLIMAAEGLTMNIIDVPNKGKSSRTAHFLFPFCHSLVNCCCCSLLWRKKVTFLLKVTWHSLVSERQKT